MRRGFAATILALAYFDATNDAGGSFLVWLAIYFAIGSARKDPE